MGKLFSDILTELNGNLHALIVDNNNWRSLISLQFFEEILNTITCEKKENQLNKLNKIKN